ncbi:unnamed protein product [Gongylonema pulchrum]|uniref:C2H2-type domain-containing protein n=1 Tax=Gongylonema pulchrum TaxID=637853 RepID=A0A183DCU9_9BILA|nr:unnamed protein product [Gongylonema pulchrum]
MRKLVAYISYLLIFTGFFTARADNETNLEMPTQFQMPQTRESYFGVPGSFHVEASTDDDLTELLTMDPYPITVQANDPAFAECVPEQWDVDFYMSQVDFELPDGLIERLRQESLTQIQESSQIQLAGNSGKTESDELEADFPPLGTNFELPYGFIEGLGQEPLNRDQKFFDEPAEPETSRKLPNDYISQYENFVNQIYNHDKNLAQQPHSSSDLLSNTQIPGSNQIQLAGSSGKTEFDELRESVIFQQIFGETDGESSKNITDYGNSSKKTNDRDKTLKETTAGDKALTSDGEPLKEITKISERLEKTAVAPPDYLCGFSGCKEGFNLNERYVQHLRSHNKRSEFVCHWLRCGTPLATAALLSEHLLQHVLTNSPKASVHKCADCLEWFWRKTRLTSHQAKSHIDRGLNLV